MASAWKLGPVNFGKPTHGAAVNDVKSIDFSSPKPLASNKYSRYPPITPKMIGNLRQIPGAATAISPDDQNREQPDPGIELATAHGFNGHGREIETNCCDDRASHNRRRQSFNLANARLHDNQSDDAVQHPRCNDAAQRNIEVGFGPWPE